MNQFSMRFMVSKLDKCVSIADLEKVDSYVKTFGKLVDPVVYDKLRYVRSVKIELEDAKWVF